jgi:hypothetical protein
VTNYAVREVVMRFQEARPKALEMARADMVKEDETDIEDGEPARQTRSRQMRTRSGHHEGTNDAPFEVPDSEADNDDDDFLPEGMAKCPMCNKAMKIELVYNHTDVCTGPCASQGRSTRSRFVVS